MKTITVLLAVLTSLLMPLNGMSKGGPSKKRIDKLLNPEKVTAKIASTRLFLEDFDQPGVFDANGAFVANGPNFSNYIPTTNPLYGSYRPGPITTGYYGVAFSNGQCTGFSNTRLGVDTHDLTTAAATTDPTNQVAWGRNYPVPPGIYELSFYTAGNTLFQDNPIEACIRKSTDYHDKVPGRLTDAAYTDIFPSQVQNYNYPPGTSPCGAFVHFWFRVTGNGFDQICLIPTPMLNGGGNHDFIIDNIEFKRISPPTPVVTIPTCGSSTVTVEIINPVTNAIYEWSVEGPSQQVLFTGPGSTYTINTVPNNITVYSVRDVTDSNNPSEKGYFNPVLNNTPPSVNNIARCGAGEITLTINNPPALDYEWFMVTNTGPIPVSPDPPINHNYSLTTYVSQTSQFKVRTKGQVYCPSGPEQTILVTVFRISPTITLNTALSGTAPYYRGTALQFTAGIGNNTGQVLDYQWTWGDQSSAGPATSSANAVHTFARAGTYNISVTVSERFSVPNASTPATSTCSETAYLAVIIKEPLCEIAVPFASTATGVIERNATTGAIQYTYNNSCAPAITLECLGEQPKFVSNVVSISTTAFADSLVQDVADYRTGAYAAIPFLEGKKRFRPYATYTYNSSLTPTANNLNFETGRFPSAAFNWNSSARARPGNWLASSISEKMTPDGESLQDVDPLQIRSTAKFGYGIASVPQATGPGLDASTHTLPYLIAHNADYQTTFFESFENIYGPSPNHFGEDRYQLDAAELNPVSYTLPTSVHHTGRGAARLNLLGGIDYRLTLPNLPITLQVQQNGIWVKAWVHHNLGNFAGHVELIDKPEDYANRTLDPAPLEIVARSGEWILVAAKVSVVAGISAGYPLSPQIVITGTTGTGSEVWVDDVRMQPGNAEMAAYVYDPETLRLVASFDDQHFGLLYQYNPEGKLIRKLAETERGVKTLQETQYNTATP